MVEMKRMEQDWVRHPFVAAIARIGGWGLYAAVVVLVLISLLELVDARNERVWWVTLAIGQIAAIAWVASWAVILVVEAANWLARKVEK